METSTACFSNRSNDRSHQASHSYNPITDKRFKSVSLHAKTSTADFSDRSNDHRYQYHASHSQYPITDKRFKYDNDSRNIFRNNL